MEGNQTRIIGGIVILLLAGGAYLLYTGSYLSSPEPTLAELEGEVILNDLEPGTYVTSPLTFSGTAATEWFNEAGEFSIEVRDDDGAPIGGGKAVAGGNAGDGRISFTATISFSTPSTERGLVMFMRSNVTGPSQNNFNIGVTVLFVPPVQQE